MWQDRLFAPSASEGGVDFREVTALVRLILAASLLVLAGGSVVGSHDQVPGWTHRGLDHPPSALHATVLEHLRYLAHQGDETSAGASFTAAPAATVLAVTLLAVLARRAPRPWRPSALGIRAIHLALASAQRAAAPAPLPPRRSFYA